MLAFLKASLGPSDLHGLVAVAVIAVISLKFMDNSEDDPWLVPAFTRSKAGTFGDFSLFFS
jgi:hypothetical protein